MELSLQQKDSIEYGRAALYFYGVVYLLIRITYIIKWLEGADFDPWLFSVFVPIGIILSCLYSHLNSRVGLTYALAFCVMGLFVQLCHFEFVFFEISFTLSLIVFSAWRASWTIKSELQNVLDEGLF